MKSSSQHFKRLRTQAARRVWSAWQLPGVVVLDKFLHCFNAAFADVPEVLLQRGLDGTLQRWILFNQHLYYKAKHFTLLIVHLKDKCNHGFRTKMGRKWDCWRKGRVHFQLHWMDYSTEMLARWLLTIYMCAHVCVQSSVDIFASATCCQTVFFLQCLYNPATMEIWKARGHLFRQVGGSTRTLSHTNTDKQNLMWCLSQWRRH